MKQFYFVCLACNAKWFGNAELSYCRRCGEIVTSKEQVIPPWIIERRAIVRITRKSYERARTVVEQAREQLRIVKAWEETVRRLGDLGSQQLVAITVNDDGSIKTECELVSGAMATAAFEETPEMPK